jgi:hypothetical protein
MPSRTTAPSKPKPKPTSRPTRTIDPSALPSPDLSPYTTAQIRFAIAAWPMRAAQELRSALVFRALAAAARAVAMPAPWPSRFFAAAHDEIRHARLCAIVGEDLGAEPPAWNVDSVRDRLGALPNASSRVATLLLVEVAIGETLSSHLFRAGQRAAIEPRTRAALGVILRDEIRHQRLGWDALAALWATLDEPRRAAMQRTAAAGLASCERDIALPALRRLEANAPFDPAYAALGVLHPETRVEAFYRAVERRIVPRLDRLGLDGQRAWRDRYRVR